MSIEEGKQYNAEQLGDEIFKAAQRGNKVCIVMFEEETEKWLCVRLGIEIKKEIPFLARFIKDMAIKYQKEDRENGRPKSSGDQGSGDPGGDDRKED